MNGKPRVLLVEDTPSILRLYHEFLVKLDVELIDADTGAKAQAALHETVPDVVLLDLELPDANGIEVLRTIRSRALPSAVIVVTAHGSVKTAVEAMREGAYDFIVKPFAPDRLLITVRNALERRRLESLAAVSDVARSGRFCGLIGASLPMRAVYNVIESAAKSRATVFITGESGTGKELCAQAIHELSPRRDGPFVAINCGAIPRELIESELFGHVKGAFTGALGPRTGAVARPQRGTLFLDEICEMPLALQVKLLRVLQSAEFTKVGGSEIEHADVRYVCATNRDPGPRCRPGGSARTSTTACMSCPARCRRCASVTTTCCSWRRHFLALYADEEGKSFEDFDTGTVAALHRYAWPGNIRELQNVLRNVVLFNPGGTVTETMLPRLDAASAPRPAAVFHRHVPPRPERLR